MNLDFMDNNKVITEAEQNRIDIMEKAKHLKVGSIVEIRTKYSNENKKSFIYRQGRVRELYKNIFVIEFEKYKESIQYIDYYKIVD